MGRLVPSLEEVHMMVQTVRYGLEQSAYLASNGEISLATFHGAVEILQKAPPPPGTAFGGYDIEKAVRAHSSRTTRTMLVMATVFAQEFGTQSPDVKARLYLDNLANTTGPWFMRRPQEGRREALCSVLSAAVAAYQAFEK